MIGGSLPSKKTLSDQFYSTTGDEAHSEAGVEPIPGQTPAVWQRGVLNWVNPYSMTHTHTAVNWLHLENEFLNSLKGGQGCVVTECSLRGFTATQRSLMQRLLMFTTSISVWGQDSLVARVFGTHPSWFIPQMLQLTTSYRYPC